MNPFRTRVALAAGVAVLCAAVSLVLVLTLGSAPTSGTLARVEPLKIPRQRDPHFLDEVGRKVAAGQKSDGAPVPGVTEGDLHVYETAVLGSEHADEHAADRKAERDHPEELRRQYLAARGPLPAHVAAATDDPAKVGQWVGATGDPATNDYSDTEYKLPIVGIHGVLLHTGKILYFSYRTYATGGQAARNVGEAFLWDPEHPSADPKLVPPPPETDPNADNVGQPANLWCAGQTLLEDGRVVVFGGNRALPPADGSANWKGLNEVYTFDPDLEKWTRQGDMRHGRWYPTGIRLPDGQVPILSGLDESGNLDGQINPDIELFTPSAQVDGSTTPKLIGEADGQDTHPPLTSYYPHMFSMASGRTLIAGPENTTDTWSMKVNPAGTSFTWREENNFDQYRLWGSGVPLATTSAGPTKVMLIGGKNNYDTASDGVDTTTTFDEDTGEWTPSTSMHVGRAHANTVLLPDGSMVEIGGGYGSRPGDGQYASSPEQRTVELWDPDTKEWTQGPAQAEPRAYHSTALLLPDGRVVSAGDDRIEKAPTSGSAPQDTAEIYEPPYLHRGPRPEITSSPETAQLGSTFAVGSTGEVTKAALVAPGAVTHAVDMNQRYIPVNVDQRAGGVTVHAPPDQNAAPPGYYMLFLLDSDGVPSKAKFVRLVRPTPPATDQGTGTGTTSPTTPAPTPGLTTAKPKAPTTVGTALSVASKLTRKGSTVKVGRRGTFAIMCRSDGGARRSCRVDVRGLLKRGKTRSIGSGRATIASRKREAKTTVRLTRTGRRLLSKASRRKGLTVRIDLRVTESGTKRSGTARKRYRLIL